MKWLPLNSLDDISLHETSDRKVVVLFKHSTRCGISSIILKHLNKDLESAPIQNGEYYILDVIANRAISNAIAEKYGVKHESPQILILKQGKLVHHASHHRIAVKDIIYYESV